LHSSIALGCPGATGVTMVLIFRVRLALRDIRHRLRKKSDSSGSKGPQSSHRSELVISRTATVPHRESAEVRVGAKAPVAALSRVGAPDDARTGRMPDYLSRYDEALIGERRSIALIFGFLYLRRVMCCITATRIAALGNVSGWYLTLHSPKQNFICGDGPRWRRCDPFSC